MLRLEASNQASKRDRSGGGVQVPADTLEPFLEKLSDEAQRQFVVAGVGVIHDTLSAAERSVLNLLFARGAIQVRFQ